MTPHDLVLTPRGVRFRGRRLPCAIGRGGVTPHKREGDGATPAGTHRITGIFYRPDRMARPSDWAAPVGPRDLWSDDPRDSAYNRHVRAPHAGSFEALRRPDPLYDVVLITDWNRPDATPGKGSAIFVHVWRAPRRPTAGCVAFSRRDLLWIVRHIRPGARLIVPVAAALQR